MLPWHSGRRDRLEANRIDDTCDGRHPRDFFGRELNIELAFCRQFGELYRRAGIAKDSLEHNVEPNVFVGTELSASNNT